jgi:hypothetical protein
MHLSDDDSKYETIYMQEKIVLNNNNKFNKDFYKPKIKYFTTTGRFI